MQPQDNTKNTVLFVVLSMAMLIVYWFAVLGPEQKRKAAIRAAQPSIAQQAQNPVLGAPAGTIVVKTRAEALASTARVTIDTPALQGSIALVGARFDDLQFKQYRQTVDPKSPPVELFEPNGAPFAYFSQFGWSTPGPTPAPGQQAMWISALDQEAVWRPVGATVLRVGQPVDLEFTTVEGLRFQRHIEIDNAYMFTITDKVANNTGRPVVLAPYGSVQRRGLPPELSKGNPIIHEGAIGWDKHLSHVKYKDWAKKPPLETNSIGGWFGITDKYWLAALIPDQGRQLKGTYRVTPVQGVPVYEATYQGNGRALEPGFTRTETTRLFAGVKRAEVLSAYQDNVDAFKLTATAPKGPALFEGVSKFFGGKSHNAKGVPEFDQAIDWGMFWFFTRPFFKALEALFHLVGNFGVAILLLTVAVKILFFPLANQAFASMSKMKKLQPKVEELKAKYGNDQAKQQQELMALYQSEKINPAGRLSAYPDPDPGLLRPVQDLFVTIEMRHAPFFGWIQDLSARDPRPSGTCSA
jgi:YidC/Oxa1 family membrane protein insertase